MERLLGFVKEPLIEREIKMKDQKPKQWHVHVHDKTSLLLHTYIM